MERVIAWKQTVKQCFSSPFPSQRSLLFMPSLCPSFKSYFFCSPRGLPRLFTSVLLKYISLFLLPLMQLISCSDQPPPQPLRVFLRCNKISLSWEMQWMHVSGQETSFLRAVECARGPDKWEMKNRGRWKTGCETPGGAERGGLTERTCRVHLGSNWRERSRQEQEAIKGQFKGGR